ncbi:hypothetical protein R1sor_002682 [Riccia sorocarpa]|uniref:Myb/SANT-like DNA-binding domain-containing protein n=1 Tax=Riccia sorocarpa TaxID=122646 RepID=A0ABD3GZG4_9MARC
MEEHNVYIASNARPAGMSILTEILGLPAKEVSFAAFDGDHSEGGAGRAARRVEGSVHAEGTGNVAAQASSAVPAQTSGSAPGQTSGSVPGQLPIAAGDELPNEYCFLPGRDVPLPESSPENSPIAADGDLGDFGSDGDSKGEGDDDAGNEDLDEEGNSGSRTFWRDWEVVALIESQKELTEFCAQLKGRKKKTLSSDDKWDRVERTMTEKAVGKSRKQMKGKWKTLLQEYRKINDYDKKSGNGPWSSMSRAERKQNKLPVKFADQWFSLLDTFQHERHINNPVCLESSSKAPVGGRSL